MPISLLLLEHDSQQNRKPRYSDQCPALRWDSPATEKDSSNDDNTALLPAAGRRDRYHPAHTLYHESEPYPLVTDGIGATTHTRTVARRPADPAIPFGWLRGQSEAVAFHAHRCPRSYALLPVRVHATTHP